MSEQAAVQTQQKAPSPSHSGGVLQRACACGQHTGGGECASCKKKRMELQRSAVQREAPNAAPPIVHEVLRGPGHPLEKSARGLMEARFGQDFSRVRVHTDAKAARSARAVNALAYTVGQNVVFGPDQYQPHSPSGQRLLAHELTHVTQQSAHAGGLPSRLEIGPVNDPYEHQAAQMAAGAARFHQAAEGASAGAGTLQRDIDPEYSTYLAQLDEDGLYYELAQAQAAQETADPISLEGIDNLQRLLRIMDEFTRRGLDPVLPPEFEAQPAARPERRTSTPTNPDAFHGIELYYMVQQVPHTDFTDTRLIIRLPPYILGPNQRRNPDGSNSILYYIAFNTERNTNEYVIGPELGAGIYRPPGAVHPRG